jgi:hypothetical protein
MHHPKVLPPVSSLSPDVRPPRHVSSRTPIPDCPRSLLPTRSNTARPAEVNDAPASPNVAPEYPQRVADRRHYTSPSIARATVSLRRSSGPLLQSLQQSRHGNLEETSTFAPRSARHPLRRAAQTAVESLPRACSLPKDQKEPTVLRFLQQHEGMCILHVLVDGGASHKLCACDAWTTFRTSYHSFRSHIRFLVKGVCYRCGVPTSKHFDHPFRSGNEDPACRFDDILKPLSWVLYSIPSLKAVVMDHAGVSPDHFRTSRDYAAWLGEDRHGSESLLINLLELCHAYIYLLDNDRSVLLSCIS